MPKTMTRLAVTESRPFIEAVTAAEGDSRFLITLITPGQGSSGYYPQATLEQAGRDGVFPAGLHMYVNHQTSQEWAERPEGDINGLAAVLAEDAYWDPERKALVAEAKVFRHWADRLKDLVEAIGVSIRAYCDAEVQDIDGTPKNVVTRIVEAISTDFVTHAGRGGLFEVLESARRAPINAATRRGLSEATANARRAELSELIREEYAAEKTWVWLRDYDDTTVWFEVETVDEAAIWQQAYEVENDRASALTGERVEVRVEVRYVPVNATNSTEAATGEWSYARFSEAWQKAIEGGTWQVVHWSDADKRPAWITATDPTQTTPSAPAAESAPATSPDFPAGESAPKTPVDPAGNTNPATESEEDTMPQTQIEESRLQTLEEAASRVPALEQERDKALTESQVKDRRIAQLEAGDRARDFAEKRVREANKSLTNASVAKIVRESTKDVPLGDDLRLDLTRLTEAVDRERADEEAYLASVAEESGVGQVRGFGADNQTVTAPTPDEEAAAFNRAFSGVKG